MRDILPAKSPDRSCLSASEAENGFFQRVEHGHRVSQVMSKLICSRAARRKITKSRARRVAANIAKLPELLRH
jgi:hypothetical protein